MGVSVKALVFDVFGTVVDWRSGIAAAGAAVGAAHGITADWEAFADAWRGRYKPTMDRVRKGELPWTKLDPLHRMSLDAIAPEFGLAALPKAVLDELNLAWHRLPSWPDSVAGLTLMKRRYTLGTLSNGNVSLLADMAKTVHLPWDVILSAELFHHYKPDPETYLGAAELLSLPPHEVMLVAAHNDDLAAAASCGLRTAFVPRPKEHGPGQKTDLASTRANDIVARDFLDLARQLGC